MKSYRTSLPPFIEERDFFDEFQDGSFKTVDGREASRKSEVEIMLKKKDGLSYLLCGSEGRKAKETAIRNRAEEKLEEALNKLKKGIESGRENNPETIERRIGKYKSAHSKAGKYYEISCRHREFSRECADKANFGKRFLNSLKKLKEKADGNGVSFPAVKKKLEELKAGRPALRSKVSIHLIPPSLTWSALDEIEAEERKLDGNCLLKTNREDLDESSVWSLYMMLTGAEEAFRNLKSYLGPRPNFHRLTDRVNGHIFISVLAYHPLHAIECGPRQKGDHSGWTTIKRVASTHNYSTPQLPTVNGTPINLRKPGVPEGTRLDIYRKLDIDYKSLPIRKNLA